MPSGSYTWVICLLEIELKDKVSHLCDYTFNFYWHEQKLNPNSTIPHQEGTEYTYQQLVDMLRKGENIHITGNVGERLAYCMGTDLKNLGGSGATENAGNIFIQGNAGREAGMGMVSGAIYVTGNIEQPLGNLIEVVSDVSDYRKFISITSLLCNGLDEKPVKNILDPGKKELILNDGIQRGTLATRCDHDVRIIVEGDVYNGTGLLMEKGMVQVKGNAGLNTASHLNGGTLSIEGDAGEFAGTYMKRGTLILNSSKGYAGAGIEDGVIYSRHKLNVAPPAQKFRLKGEDSSVIRNITGTGRFESMLYNKYMRGEEKPQYVMVHMRDGSIVQRKIDQ